MSWLDAHLLSIATFLPLVGALVVLLAGNGAARVAAIGCSVAVLAPVARALSLFVPAQSGIQLAERGSWIPTLNVAYFVGVDGLSVALVALTAILVPISILAARKVPDRARVYFALVLLLETALLGAFTALSFFHWFLFWELSLVPSFFLVKMWGGRNASRAALTFFLYTLVGSVTMLVAFGALWLATGTFDFIELARLGDAGAITPRLGALARGAGLGVDGATLGTVAFFAIALAFFVKTPLWPLHTWLPETYVEAPAPVTMLLTGALSKLGVYGLLRIALPLFPSQANDWSGVLTAFAVVTIVAGAFAALAQSDLKKMMAYSSMAHVGYCLLGAFAAAAAYGEVEARTTALVGVVVQMFNHGVSAAALFYFVHLLEQKTRLRGIDDFGGLRTTTPWLAWCLAFALFGSLGLPGLSGFVGELLIFKGALSLYPVLAGAALLGLVVTAIYCLRIVQRVCAGPVAGRSSEVHDLVGSERVAAFILCALILGAGLWPSPWVNAANATVQSVVQASGPSGGAQ